MPNRPGHHGIHTNARKRIALVAHRKRRRELLEWARHHRHALHPHELLAAGAAGDVANELDLEIAPYRNGLRLDDQPPDGRVEGRLDLVIFFWDPLEPHPHDATVLALLRDAVVGNVPIACTRPSADLMLASPRAQDEYACRPPAFDERMWHPELAVTCFAPVPGPGAVAAPF